ncbi:MAG: hypothetical protein A3F16_03440 [Deltaproteobacteria bacterium RIFCSPHIGHO2_12_FULL_43_9]|nr:MAG: hypothetical protein A3F16_03440 [Deltaproteobacteria bacterium RIFCSPHIGHO2_12_FULL_43_9]
MSKITKKILILILVIDIINIPALKSSFAEESSVEPEPIVTIYYLRVRGVTEEELKNVNPASVLKREESLDDTLSIPSSRPEAEGRIAGFTFSVCGIPARFKNDSSVANDVQLARAIPGAMDSANFNSHLCVDIPSIKGPFVFPVDYDLSTYNFRKKFTNVMYDKVDRFVDDNELIIFTSSAALAVGGLTALSAIGPKGWAIGACVLGLIIGTFGFWNFLLQEQLIQEKKEKMFETYIVLADFNIQDNPEMYLASNTKSTFRFVTNPDVVFGYARIISEQLSVVTDSGPVPQSDEEWKLLRDELNEKILKAGYILEVNINQQ